MIVPWLRPGNRQRCFGCRRVNSPCEIWTESLAGLLYSASEEDAIDALDAAEVDGQDASFSMSDDVFADEHFDFIASIITPSVTLVIQCFCFSRYLGQVTPKVIHCRNENICVVGLKYPKSVLFNLENKITAVRLLRHVAAQLGF